MKLFGLMRFRIPLLISHRSLAFFSSLSFRKAIPVYSRYLTDDQSKIQFSIFEGEEMFKIIGKNENSLKELISRFKTTIPKVKSLYGV